VSQASRVGTCKRCRGEWCISVVDALGGTTVLAGGNARLRSRVDAPSGTVQAKTHACAVASRRQVAPASEKTRLRSVFDAPSGTGKRKRTPAQSSGTGKRKHTSMQCFRCAKWHWQAKTLPAQYFERTLQAFGGTA